MGYNRWAARRKPADDGLAHYWVEVQATRWGFGPHYTSRCGLEYSYGDINARRYGEPKCPECEGTK